MNKKIIYLAIIFLFLGCINTQSSFPQRNFDVKLNEKFKLQLLSGNYTITDTIDGQVFYHLTFNKVKGGESYLFGIWKISEKSGIKANRLKLLQEDKEINSLSIADLERNQIDSRFIDLNQYVQKD